MTDSQKIDCVIDELRRCKFIHLNSKYNIISTVNNLVLKIEDKYLKIYTNRGSTQKDNELILYKKLKHNRLYKEVLAQGVVDNVEYALFREIKGKMLEQVMYSTKHAKEIAHAVYDFIEDTTAIDCSKYGYISDENFVGSHNSLINFLFEFYGKVGNVLWGNQLTKKYAKLPLEIVRKSASKLKNISPKVIPVDLNSRNIMIENDGKVKIIDPGILIAAIPEMAYGNFRANTLGTSVFNEFEKLIFSADQQLVKDFSTLHLLNILSFVEYYKTGNPIIAKPYGNNKTIVDLIEENIRI